MEEILIILGGLIAIVLAIAIVQAKFGSNIPDERLQIWLRYWKFIFGTFVIGLVTALINWQIQTSEIERDSQIKDKELELAETTQENENLKHYIQYALTKDLETRRAFANYFAYVSKNSKSQERWRTYANFVDTEIKKVEKQKEEKQKELNAEKEKTKQLKNKLASIEKGDKERISELTEDLLSTRKSQVALEQQLKALQAELKTTVPLAAPSFGPNERLLGKIIDEAPVVNTTQDIALDIKTGNTATKISADLWEWTVFLQGDEEVLAQIQCVEYTLHRTFKNPVIEICDRGLGEQAFPLTARGWGTFPIKISILRKDGHVEKITHDLKFYR